MPSHRIAEYDVWRPGYGGAVVSIYIAGTTTLASVYTDPALTVAAPNPQTLLSQTINNVVYGKWSVPIYTSSDYYTRINTTGDQTGNEQLPLYELIGEDASLALVTGSGAQTTANTLADILAREIQVRDFGVFLPTSDPASSSATNDATLDSAISAAASLGGGCVRLPPGTFEVTDFTLPAGVILCGKGVNTTTILSNKAGVVCTIAGERAGFRDMVLDGNSLVASSVGISSIGIDELIFQNFRIQRFEDGLYMKGGQRAIWIDFSIENCGDGAKLYGDTDAGGGAGGSAFKHNLWIGGTVSNCTAYGVDLRYIDADCWHNKILGVAFDTNTGIALNVSGARFTEVETPEFVANTTTLNVTDGSDTVIGLTLTGGKLSGGAVDITGTAQDVSFRRMEISDVDFTLTAPGDNILFIDCIEDNLVTISGSGAKFLRQNTNRSDWPNSFGVTTDASQIEGWSYELAPGEAVMVTADIVANRRDGEGRAMYALMAFLHRPGSTLDYITQTANFVVGSVVTGAISNATARIVADSDAGATGTLTLRSITGAFQNGELITGSGGGSATVNGTLVSQDAALIGSVISREIAYESSAALDATLGATSTRVVAAVTGIAAESWEWVIGVRVSSNG